MTLSRRALSAVLFAALTLSAQTKGLQGHWSGTIEVPNQALAVEIDIDQTAKGWIGAISIPAQNATGIPLDQISDSGGKVSFHISAGAGGPTFTGTISEDGKTISGDFVQAGQTMPFKLTRNGEAKVELPKASPAVAPEFLGDWEGTLEAGPQTLRLILKLSNGADGADGAKGTLISVDQGGVEIPVTSIETAETRLTLVVNAVGGGFKGEINKEGTELAGIWSQGGAELPLKLKKSGAK
jgi:hypothetical protein